MNNIWLSYSIWGGGNRVGNVDKNDNKMRSSCAQITIFVYLHCSILRAKKDMIHVKKIYTFNMQYYARLGHSFIGSPIFRKSNSVPSTPM